MVASQWLQPAYRHCYCSAVHEFGYPDVHTMLDGADVAYYLLVTRRGCMSCGSCWLHVLDRFPDQSPSAHPQPIAIRRDEALLALSVLCVLLGSVARPLLRAVGIPV